MHILFLLPIGLTWCDSGVAEKSNRKSLYRAFQEKSGAGFLETNFRGKVIVSDSLWLSYITNLYLDKNQKMFFSISIVFPPLENLPNSFTNSLIVFILSTRLFVANLVSVSNIFVLMRDTSKFSGTLLTTSSLRRRYSTMFSLIGLMFTNDWLEELHRFSNVWSTCLSLLVLSADMTSKDRDIPRSNTVRESPPSDHQAMLIKWVSKDGRQLYALRSALTAIQGQDRFATVCTLSTIHLNCH